MYGVQRSEKYKRQDIAGIQKEATRTADHYNNDVDTGRSQYNITLIDCGDWMQQINDTIANTGVRMRKDSVLAIGSVYTATGEFFNRQAGETKQEWNNRVLGYFNDCLDWHIKTYCQGNRDLVLSAVIHQDETTLHLQTYSMPIIDRGNGKYALSAKSIMGNKKDYTNRVDSFYNDVSKKYGLERGERTPEGQVAKKHIETQKYKLLKMQQDLQETKAELTSIEQDKIIADFDKMELDQQIRITESKKQKLYDEINGLQQQARKDNQQIQQLQEKISHQKKEKQGLKHQIEITENKKQKLYNEIYGLQQQTRKGKQQVQELQQQINDKQKQLTDLNMQTKKCMTDNAGLQKEIEQQSAVIARNNKKIAKQQQDIQCYDNMKQALGELQDWLSYDTYIHSVIDKMPVFYQGIMPEFLKNRHEKYYNDNIKPIADYTNCLADEIQTNEQYIDDDEIEL